jgi:DNA polymerase-3 subunit epsilon
MEHGLIVDLETSGLNPEQDQIIEIGLIEFAYQADTMPMIINMYSGLEEPTQEISEEITRITGITNLMLKGRTIDWEFVRALVERASIVIAHNVAFDSSFLRLRPELAGAEVHWACSAKHIDWTTKGFRTRALNYLAADHGFLNPFAHRALFDAATTFRLVAPHLDELIERSYEKELVVEAVGSPFESKDVLRLHGYRWDPQNRFWFKVVLQSELEAERRFLSEEVYNGAPRHVEREVAGIPVVI